MGGQPKKSQLFETKCCGCFTVRDSRFSLIPHDAAVSWAYSGIWQSIFATPEIASRVPQTKGGRSKIWKMTLNLNCAERFRPSEMMPKGQNQNKANMRGGLAPRATDIMTSQMTKKHELKYRPTTYVMRRPLLSETLNEMNEGLRSRDLVTRSLVTWHVK